MELDNRLKAVLLFVLLLLCLFPFMKPAFGLILGIAYALGIGNPWYPITNVWNKYLLQISVVGLGFSLNIRDVLEEGLNAIWFTISAIALTMLVGVFLGHALRTGKKISILIATGTAICGASAIAAMAPAIKSKANHVAVAMATIFVLNGIALILFPTLGKLLVLSGDDFGIWAALSIHDTSSVAGAAVAFGEGSVSTALTVKLTRALWIMPLTFVVGYLYHGTRRFVFPLFLIGFLIAASLNNLFPEAQSFWKLLALGAKQLLSVTLFLVGAGLTRKLVLKVGIRPFIQAFLLWLFISIVSLLAIYLHWIPKAS
jgi:uncharacterized integral membrane protein (TIGR00698 family)